MSELSVTCALSSNFGSSFSPSSTKVAHPCWLSFNSTMNKWIVVFFLQIKFFNGNCMKNPHCIGFKFCTFELQINVEVFLLNEKWSTWGLLHVFRRLKFCKALALKKVTWCHLSVSHSVNQWITGNHSVSQLVSQAVSHSFN